MTWAWLFSPCWLIGHANRVKAIVMVDRQQELHLVCGRCLHDFGVVLPHQKYRKRREKKGVKKPVPALRFPRKQA